MGGFLLNPSSTTDINFDINHFDINFAITPIDININVTQYSPMKKRQIVRSPQDLGALIAQARRQRGLSQRQLAAEFGTSQAWVSRVEQGYQKTIIGQVLRLAVHLGIELSAQTGTDAKPTKRQPPQDDYPSLDTLV